MTALCGHMQCNFHWPSTTMCCVCQLLIFPAFLLLLYSAHYTLCFALSPSTFAVLREQLCSVRTGMNISPCNLGCEPVSQSKLAVWDVPGAKPPTEPVLPMKWGFAEQYPSAGLLAGAEMPLHLLSYMKCLRGKIH